MNTSNYNALMAELRAEYLESFQEKFSKIKESYQKSDWYSLELEYHNLKGTGTTYGVPEVTELCQQMERISRSNGKIEERFLIISIELLTKIQNKYVNSQPFNLATEPDFLKICNYK